MQIHFSTTQYILANSEFAKITVSGYILGSNSEISNV